MKKIIARGCAEGDRFLAMVTAKILNNDRFNQLYLSFLESKKFDDANQEFLNALSGSILQLNRIGTIYDKQLVKRYLSTIYSKLKDLHAAHHPTNRCWGWFSQDPYDTQLKNALYSIFTLICNIHDKECGDFPLRKVALGGDMGDLDTMILEGHNTPVFTKLVPDQHKPHYFRVDLKPLFRSPKSKVMSGINELNEPIVVKQKKCTSEDEKNWENEREILQKLSTVHSNILKPIAYFKQNQVLYTVLPMMGFFYENSPGSVWRDTYVCFKNVVPSALKLCLAKHYFAVFVDVVKNLHDLGVFHLDLKPENGLLDARGNLMVTDFEFSTTERLVSKHNIQGTIGFIYPELESSNSNAKLDLWALGATLYALCLNGTLTEHKHILGSKAINMASQNLKQFLEQIAEDDDAQTIKKVIEYLTVFLRPKSNSDTLLAEISEKTASWKRSEASVISMLLLLSKERKVLERRGTIA